MEQTAIKSINLKIRFIIAFFDVFIFIAYLLSLPVSLSTYLNPRLPGFPKPIKYALQKPLSLNCDHAASRRTIPASFKTTSTKPILNTFTIFIH
jgi:hypothetical protein